MHVTAKLNTERLFVAIAEIFGESDGNYLFYRNRFILEGILLRCIVVNKWIS